MASYYGTRDGQSPTATATTELDLGHFVLEPPHTTSGHLVE